MGFTPAALTRTVPLLYHGGIIAKPSLIIRRWLRSEVREHRMNASTTLCVCLRGSALGSHGCTSHRTQWNSQPGLKGTYRGQPRTNVSVASWTHQSIPLRGSGRRGDARDWKHELCLLRESAAWY
jgi:hypothetical protein